MAKRAVSYRLSQPARDKLTELAKVYGNRTTVVELAIDRLHRQEGTMTEGTISPRTLEITNWTRRRRWGWGVSVKPTGEDAWSISPPQEPDHVGTIRQVVEAIRGDEFYQSIRNAYHHTRWFYDGIPIRGIQSKLGTISPPDALEWVKPDRVILILSETPADPSGAKDVID